MESTVAQSIRIYRISKKQRKKNEFWHYDGNVPVQGRAGERERHSFSLRVCMGQTHAFCRLVCCSEHCSMHKHVSPRRPSLLGYSQASVTQG